MSLGCWDDIQLPCCVIGVHGAQVLTGPQLVTGSPSSDLTLSRVRICSPERSDECRRSRESKENSSSTPMSLSSLT